MGSTFSRRSFGALTGGALGAVAVGKGLGAPALAQGLTKLRMVLNWRYQGPQSWFFIAQDKGYLREAGIELDIDQGDGSGAAVGRVASGAYDMGFGDINALMVLAGRKPAPDASTPIGIYMMFNRPPFTIAVKADGPIKTPRDLEGRTLGGPANDGALQLFPAFCKLAGVDASKVSITNMAPNLREQMLQRDQVAGVFGFVNTIRFSAKLVGIDPDKQFRFINYGDHGMDLYSNCLIVSRKLAADNPGAARGVVRAFNRGLVDTLRDHDAAVEAVARREPLINKAVEKERLVATLQDEMAHPEIATLGLGAPDPARLAKAIGIVREANGLPRAPGPAEIFNDAFLPPMAERITKLA
ncbi:ABC transporter substrate-binding protein [Phreatobacter stygius]|uniref:Thiamine pyrimidine synthase n=1 Tax=Phreatobacter stygius TaxID=1940610 RepID=A0A4D7B4V0_9HYPH|nr:ABC transporter substrate-binding protein [Phreatobacter stygius]QCI64716.1 ABC transporter substrate-binding protein [Phreatobacter stygius]